MYFLISLIADNRTHRLGRPQRFKSSINSICKMLDGYYKVENHFYKLLKVSFFRFIHILFIYIGGRWEG